MKSSIDIGSKLKRFRVERGLTLEQVARELNFAPSYLSRLERNICSPALETLYDLARFYRVEITRFFRKEWMEEGAGRVLRAGERDCFVSRNGKIRTWPFAHLKYQDPSFEVYTVEQAPGVTRRYRPSAGEAYVLVQSGMLELVISGEQYILRSGDSIYFSLEEPRAFATKGKRRLKMLVAIYRTGRD